MTKKFNRRGIAAAQALTAMTVVHSVPVRAQENSSGDDIIITASKRPEPLSRSPMSVTVVTEKQLRQTDTDSFAEFAKLVPGLSYIDSGPGNKRYALRGLQSAGEPEVALFYDETPVSGIPGGSLDTGDSQPDLTLWDVDRIEVLRGPQGTLYGNGSMGGAIRILSRRPVFSRTDASAEISGGVTNGGAPSLRLYGMINVPLIKDRLSLRVTGYRVREGGWIDDKSRSDIALPQTTGNDLNWEHRDGGRASLAFQAAPNWLITAIGYYQQLATGNSFETYPNFATSSDPYVSKSYVRTPWRDRSRILNLISVTDFGDTELTATGSYQKRDVQRTIDSTRFLLNIFQCDEFTWQKTCFGPGIVPAASYSAEGVRAGSAEVRLTSKHPGPLQWTVGAFWQDSKTYRRGSVATTDADGLILFDPVTGDAEHRLFARNNDDTFSQYAVFGEASYDLTDRLKAIGGLRWFHSRRTDQQTIVQQFFPGQPTGEQPFQSFSQSALFKKIELSYSLGANSLVYAEAAQGFRAGGPNFPGGFNLSAPPYRADSVWDYELGWKLSLANRKLYLTGALFDIEWNDLQQLVPTPLFSYISNAGRARSTGFDSELHYKPVDPLELTGGITFNNARLVGPQPLQTDPTLQLQSGDRLANVPKWTANGSIAYSFELVRGRPGLVRIDASYLSDRGNLVALRSAAYRRIGSSTLVDAHAELGLNRHWTLGLDAQNIFNAFAPISAKPLDANFAPTITAARPRTLSVRLDFDY